ncbi:hypothetical protein VNI00_006973 [Paramarasmius palmivorus]|uniref:Uncharacterized protein n=1 Tax=Paramarasmius palmivorus TaxID=297713 RepID=A0AAW0D5E1_9AGAR
MIMVPLEVLRSRYSEPNATKNSFATATPRAKRSSRHSESHQAFTTAPSGPHDKETIEFPLDSSASRRLSAVDVESELKKLRKDAFMEKRVDLTKLSRFSLPYGYTLSPHQVAGILWMLNRESPINKKFGGILADEMGLGKTLQTVAVIMLDAEDSGPSLIVVQNVTLAQQWRDEIERFFPGTLVRLYHGPNRFASLQEMQQYKIVVTTYGVVRAEHLTFERDNSRRTSENCRDALFRTFWRRVALDEAHMIRNKETKGAKACCDLSATFRWCITATPLQNKVTDLYTLFHFLQVQPFSDYNWFKQSIEMPLKTVKSPKINEWAIANSLNILRIGLGHVLLRRRKDDYINDVKVLDMPEYKLRSYECKLPPDERALYDALQNRDLLVKSVQPDTREMERDPDAETDGDDDDGYSSRLECPQCKSPLSLTNNDEAKAHQETCKLITQLISSRDNQPPSQRVEAIEAILDTIPSGEKVIVFSSFVTMLDVIYSYIGNKFHCVHYNGSMKAPERENSLKAIREDPNVKVILMSLKAGGVGLNLAECNHVILVDLWWNPAVEEQAIGRVHRMGQTRQVHVYKLFAENTIESRIKELQEDKRVLADAALDDDQLQPTQNLSLGREDVIRLMTGKTRK